MKACFFLLLVLVASAHTIHDIQILWEKNVPEKYGCYRYSVSCCADPP